MLAKALYICQDITFVAEQRGSSAFETPQMNGDLGVLVDRLASIAAGIGLHEMSVYLDRHVADAHGLPATLPSTAAKCEKHAALQSARAREWRVKSLRPWMTFQRDNTPTIHIGLGYWQSQTENPLWDNDPAAAAYLLWRFQVISGIAYHAKPGVLGSILLSALYRTSAPTWHPETLPVYAQMQITDYAFFGREQADFLPGAGHVHIYDTNRAWLAGAGAADLARYPLVHTGRTQDFDPTMSGLWQVEVPAWNDKRVPHPMGSNRNVGDKAWITTPTLTLVSQLARDGFTVMPRVLDSYTAGHRRIADGKGGSKTISNTARILREWARLIDQCVKRCEHEELPLERRKLEKAFKDMYRQSVNGRWKTSSSFIFREDWYYTVGALVGANAFRKVWNTGLSEDRWPLFWGNHDAIHYISNEADPRNDKMKRFVVNDNLGGFDVKSIPAEQWQQENGL